MFFTYTIPKGDNMWEITLVGKPSDIGYFLDLKDILKSVWNLNGQDPMKILKRVDSDGKEI